MLPDAIAGPAFEVIVMDFCRSIAKIPEMTIRRKLEFEMRSAELRRRAQEQHNGRAMPAWMRFFEAVKEPA
jgi:hypothetical protein